MNTVTRYENQFTREIFPTRQACLHSEFKFLRKEAEMAIVTLVLTAQQKPDFDKLWTRLKRLRDKASEYYTFLETGSLPVAVDDLAENVVPLQRVSNE